VLPGFDTLDIGGGTQLNPESCWPKGERLQMIHPKAKASSECKGREAKNRRQTNKEVDSD
jgi:hypothetical protein